MTSKMGTTETQSQPYESPAYNNKQISKNPLKSHKDRPCGGLWKNGLCGSISLKICHQWVEVFGKDWGCGLGGEGVSLVVGF